MAYKEGTCPLPYPVEEPTSYENIKNHCCKTYKCFFLEGYVCYNPIGENPAYPHRNGAHHIPLQENKEKVIRQSTLDMCRDNKWSQQQPFFDESYFLNSRCNDQPIEECVEYLKYENCKTEISK